jgi:hypothetical protein
MFEFKTADAAVTSTGVTSSRNSSISRIVATPPPRPYDIGINQFWYGK